MTLYNRYDSGQAVRLSATFRNIDDEVADPTTVELRFKDPISGDTTSYTDADFDHDADTGVYSIDVDSTGFNEGTWYYKWIGTGVVEAAYEWAFIINHEDSA